MLIRQKYRYQRSVTAIFFLFLISKTNFVQYHFLQVFCPSTFPNPRLTCILYTSCNTLGSYFFSSPNYPPRLPIKPERPRFLWTNTVESVANPQSKKVFNENKKSLFGIRATGDNNGSSSSYLSFQVLVN